MPQSRVAGGGTTTRISGHDQRQAEAASFGEIRAYPVLPLRDIVVFPHMIVPLFVGREKSIKGARVMRSDTFILLATQKNASDDDPATGAIYETGTLASVPPVPQAARRHRQGAGRRRRARRSRATATAPNITRPTPWCWPIPPASRSKPRRWRAR